MRTVPAKILAEKLEQRPVMLKAAGQNPALLAIRIGGSSSSMADAVLQVKRLLVLLPGYAAPTNSEPFADATIAGNVLARLLAKLRRPAARDYVRFYRDFYANPRSPTYMLQCTHALFESGGPQHRTLVLGPNLDLEADATGWASEIRHSEYKLPQSSRDLAALAREYDAVLLLHSDALGLGLGTLEHALDAAVPEKVFVLNGRRRLYRLDTTMQRRLRRRRVLAETRIVESVLAQLVPVAGWVLASFDRLMGNTN